MKPARNTVAGKAQSATALAEQALALLGDAEQIGESGDAGNRCIWIARDMITNGVKRLERPSLKTLGLAQGDFYDVHSVLIALVALQKNDGRAVLGKAAAELIDKAADIVDGICVDGSEDHERRRLAEFAEVDFDAGRDLVVGMLREAERVGDNGLSSAERYARDGEAQVRYVRPYLQTLLEKPEVLEGFSAALTVTLNPEECRLSADGIEKYPAAEFEAGVPGQDGTEVGSWEPPAPPTTAVAPAVSRQPRKAVPA